MRLKHFIRLLFLFMLFGMLLSAADSYAKEPYIVVIDPGHGGENLGADYDGYLEKEINMLVANAMYEELSKYEGVKVYMTREGDRDMSLAERAEYAAGVNADLLIALHFNMSENHTLFGSEVWVSAFDEYYQEGVCLGEAVLDEFDTLGTYRKGIKTRLNDNGEDYYGIIREARAREITTVLIEHCYLDHEKDAPFRDSNEKFAQFGRLDATATAKVLGLSSETLGVDYSSYERAQVELPASVVKPDTTPPDICYLELIEADKEKRTLKLCLSAEDYDSGMLFYSYSLDGGETFSSLREWPGSDTFQFVIDVPNGISPHIVVNAYNKYDIYAASNELKIEGFPLVSQTEEESAPENENIVQSGREEASVAEAETAQKTFKEVELSIEKENAEPDRSVFAFLKISGICIGILFILLFIGYSYLAKNKRKRRRKF